MIKFLKRYVLLVIIAFLACCINVFILAGEHRMMAFDRYIFYFLYGIFALLGITIIYRDVRYYRFRSKKVWSFIPSLITIIAVVSFVCSNRYIRNLDKSPVVFIAYGMMDFNGTYIEFREDGTYKVSEYVLFMADYYRGVYSQNGEIIMLDPNGKFQQRGVLVSNLLKIVSKTSTDTNTTRKELIQIGSDQNKIKDSEVFTIR